MTILRFAELCRKYYIDPAIALERTSIQAALAAKDDELVEKILREQF